MSDVQERISRLSPAKRAMFEKRLKGEAVAERKIEEIPRRNAGEPYPLSFEQEQVWVINQLDPNAFFLHILTGYRLVGALDIEALRRTINEIIRRHENLRTTFDSVDGKPVPRVAASLTLETPLTDVSHVPEEEREAEMQRVFTQRICQPFDLSKDPLVRTALVRLSDEHHGLLVIMHHIITDRVSVDLLGRELAVIYGAFSKGQPSPLPELGIQYGDYALWVRKRLEGAAMDAHLAYWTKKLANPPTLNLPTDYPRPTTQNYPGAREFWRLPDELWEQLKALSIEENVTRFVSYLAVYSTLLYRYTGQDDMILGSPVNTRDRQELQELIGYFLNSLGLRIDLSGNPTFRELLGRIRKLSLEALAHQDLSIARVHQELRLHRAANSPLYQAAYVFVNNIEEPATEKLDLEISALRVFYDYTPMVDLALGAFDAENHSYIAFDYNTALFAPDTIRRMIGHFQTLLESAIANPDQRISEMNMLTPDEQHQLLVEWNDTGREYPSHLAVHRLFEVQAERTPEAVAVVAGAEQLSYRELNRRANQVAHYLRSLGVGAGVLVGIFIENSVEMIVGVLGVLKAGGAYLPLDTRNPPERLHFMMEDAGAAVVLMQESLADRLPGTWAQVVNIDTDRETIARYGDENLDTEVDAGSLAYVIYTSGSTGRPKGVMIPHRALVNYLTWCTERYAVAEGEGSLLHSSIGFDLTVTSLFAPLLAGQRVILLDKEQGVEALVEALAQSRDYSLVKLTPTHLEMLGRMPGLARADGAVRVRSLVVGGEALWGRSLSFWREHASPEMIINEYGPTEATVGCCVYEVNPQTELTGAVPIGRPIANTQLYILDRYLHPVPVGVYGELYIGGDGLARGYLNRPELTAERFITNPFDRQAGARLYQTGDIARYLPDGNIEFLGRDDEQVKIRGYRVELGEIEAALAGHSGVREAAVTAGQKEGDAEPQLAAYIVPANDRAGDSPNATNAPTVNELRDYLQERLPDYMLPTAYVVLDALPLTPSGKVDRRALPSVEMTRAGVESAYASPETEVEEVLVDIWKQVLGVEEVGIHDNFFELGGHSLLATQIMARVWDAFKLEISLQACFDKPTVAELGAHIEEELVAEIARLSDEEAREESAGT